MLAQQGGELCPHHAPVSPYIRAVQAYASRASRGASSTVERVRPKTAPGPRSQQRRPAEDVAVLGEPFGVEAGGTRPRGSGRARSERARMPPRRRHRPPHRRAQRRMNAPAPSVCAWGRTMIDSFRWSALASSVERRGRGRQAAMPVEGERLLRLMAHSWSREELAGGRSLRRSAPRDVRVNELLEVAPRSAISTSPPTSLAASPGQAVCRVGRSRSRRVPQIATQSRSRWRRPRSHASTRSVPRATRSRGSS